MRHKYFIHPVNFVIAFLIYSHLTAQTSTDAFTVASTAGPGLSDIRIIDLAGFGSKLWIATDGGGVNTFDGANWQVITKKDGLPADRTTSIVFAQDGTPWVGTLGAGVAKLEDDHWQVYHTADGLTSGWISCSLRSSNGDLWFGTRDGISVYDGENWSIHTTENGILGEYIAEIMQDAAGNIWAITSLGANKFNGNTWTAYTTENGLANNNVSAIGLDKNNGIWFGAWGGGVSVLSNGSWTYYLENERVRAITRDPQGDMYIAVSNGMYKYDYTDFTFTSFAEETDLHGYGNLVSDIIVDNNQNIFAGTWNGLIFANNQGWNRFRGDIGLCSNTIIDLEEDKEGRIWMGSSDRGLSIYDRGDWEVYNYNNTFEGEQISDVFRDSKDDMWVATSAGAYRYSDGEWFRMTMDDGLLHNVVYSIYEDSKGRYWFGTFGGLTIREGNSLKNLTVDDGLIDNPVLHILEDAAGNFWLGTNSGLSVYNGTTFTNYTEGSEIPANQINDIKMDGDQNIWIASSNGVSRFDGTNWEILERPLISNNSTSSIFVEENGSVWIGTFNGLNLYRDGEIKQFFSNDGTLYHNSILTLFQAGDGRLWAATYNDGVFVMDLTTSIRENTWGPSFEMYPNPATDHLTLEITEPAHSMQIMNSNGKELLSNDVYGESRVDIRISDIPTGLYHLRITYKNGKQATDKFIKVE